ncbi:site-2 protease family protein [Nakamurella leprariae]|uniref:Site-2 protease family protein n=1 Tax=Nakamurella leprariae TaxID=2803911 RepID=A0A938Y8E4_9ACTN|nr:site-2 protease family protein [Nakamurella leprariae]MBM9467730.1 site-2 protease family protein [Nakamurella leprariae]
MKSSAKGSWVFPVVLLVTAGAGAFAASGTGPPGVWVFLVVLGGWVISLCLHEFAHAAVALAFGDTSVRARGYLTLNPVRYADAGTTVVLPLLLLAIGGIPLPGGAVRLEPHRMRHPAAASMVALAGPATNLVLGVVAATVSAELAGMGGDLRVLAAALSFLAVLQFVTAVLNLVPVPGFDGFGAVEPTLPTRVRARIAPIRPWAPLVVVALLFSVPALSRALFDVGEWALRQAGGSTALAAAGSALFRFWT